MTRDASRVTTGASPRWSRQNVAALAYVLTVMKNTCGHNRFCKRIFFIDSVQIDDTKMPLT